MKNASKLTSPSVSLTQRSGSKIVQENKSKVLQNAIRGNSVKDQNRWSKDNKTTLANQLKKSKTTSRRTAPFIDAGGKQVESEAVSINVNSNKDNKDS